ncbi:MAG: DUF2961 domain-containing protein [Candidatus Hydrogenedentes bacterium]|nr:DUF2961 domain-containing protein [Candidatus Hydrogenedentota bacterium]
MRNWTMMMTVVFMALLPALFIGSGSFAVAGNPLEGLSQIKQGRTMRSSSCDVDWQAGNADARPIAPGETLVIAELEGPGVINHIWNTVAAQDKGYSRLLVLRMYWDGEGIPSVEAPLGDFFAMGHGVDHPFQSLPVTVTSEGRARNCYWPMPFHKSARITVTNEGSSVVGALYYYVDWQKLEELPANTAYFHAMYRQEFPAASGKRYLIADITGTGHYVGTVLSVRQHTASWWGEGDDFWFIDGETEPSLRGTGSEDYFCDAWGLREMSTPYYGAPLMEGYDPLSRTTCYRWHITDPVNFKASLRLEIEHMGVTFNEDGSVRSGFEERADDFSSVAFWYQAEPHKPFPAFPEGKARLYEDWSKLVEVESRLDSAKASGGPISLQEGIGTGKGQLWWTAAEPDQSLEIIMDVTEDGADELLLLLTCSHDYGIFQIELDGEPLGNAVNLYNPTIKGKEVRLIVPPLKAGQHTLRFVNQGKDPASGGYFFGLDGYMVW